MRAKATQDSLLDRIGRKIDEVIERLSDALVRRPAPVRVPVRAPAPRRRQGQ